MSSLSSYKRFSHLQIPLEVILSATDNFSDANLIKRDKFVKIYKAQLSVSDQLVDVSVARRLYPENDYRLIEFYTEVSILSKLNHKDLVSIVGFCDEKGEKIVVHKHETIRGSLDQYLRDPSLTWMRRLEICVGVACALSYIHYDEGRDFSVIHRDIKSSNILLDENWEAKLSGFEVSLTQTAARRNRLSLTSPVGSLGYGDPTYFRTGTVTHKSDMYSFGVVLFEVLCGKEAITKDKNNTRRLLAPSAISHYEEGKLEDMIDPGLWKQMDPKSFKIYSETAYYCLKEQRQQRPNIDQVLMNLERALESQRNHENPLISNSKISKRLKKMMIFEVGQEVEVCIGEAFSLARILVLYQNGALVEYDGSVDEHGFPRIDLVFYCALRPVPSPVFPKVKSGYMVERMMAFQVGQEVEVSVAESFSPARVLALYKNGALVEYDGGVDDHGFPRIQLVFYCALRPVPPPGFLKVLAGYMVEVLVNGRWWKGFFASLQTKINWSRRHL